MNQEVEREKKIVKEKQMFSKKGALAIFLSFVLVTGLCVPSALAQEGSCEGAQKGELFETNNIPEESNVEEEAADKTNDSGTGQGIDGDTSINTAEELEAAEEESEEAGGKLEEDGEEVEAATRVETEADLVQKINEAPSDGTTTTVEIKEDIILSKSVNVVVGKTIRLTGAGKTISSPAGNRHFLVEQGSTLILEEGLTLDGGGIGGGVGAKSSSAESGNFIMNGGTIRSCVAPHGGAVRIGAGGTFSMTGGLIDSNEVQDNQSDASGGGIYGDAGSSCTITGGVISNNKAVNGGGIYFGGGSFSMTGGSLVGNNATRHGGGLFLHKSQNAQITGGSTISSNTCTEVLGYGGGIFVSKSALTLNGVNVESNRANRGAGLFAEDQVTLTVNNALVTKNSATDFGGGLFSWLNNTVTMNNSEFSQNAAESGGGAYLHASALALTDTKISSNTASVDGGGVRVATGALLTLETGSLISDNKAEKFGGGIAVSAGGRTTMNAGSISGNTAHDGGGVSVREASGYDSFMATGGSIENNVAQNEGGALYSSDYQYSPTINLEKYANFSLASSVVFSGNTASFLSRPPTNYEGKQNFNGALLDNFNINYKGNADQPQTGVVYLGMVYNGGTEPVDSKGYYEGSTVTVLGNTGNLVRTGYTFTGWKIEGKGKLYTEGDTFVVAPLSSYSSNRIYLHAEWVKNPPRKFSVSYDKNNGVGNAPLDVNTYTPGSQVSVQGKGNLTRSGYTFAGWTLAADGSGITYNQGSTITMPASNVTFYAQWRYEGGGGTVDPGPDPTPTPTPTPIPLPTLPTTPGAVEETADNTELKVTPKKETTTTERVEKKTTESVTDEPEEDQNTMILFGNEVPLGGLRDHGGWSLVNLILSLLALVGAGITVVNLILNRKKEKEEQEEQDEEGTADLLKTTSQNKTIRIVASVLGIAPLVLFLILENFTQMVLFSAWTPLIAVVYLLHLIAFVMGFVVKKDTTEQMNTKNQAYSAR